MGGDQFSIPRARELGRAIERAVAPARQSVARRIRCGLAVLASVKKIPDAESMPKRLCCLRGQSQRIRKERQGQHRSKIWHGGGPSSMRMARSILTQTAE
jgi:hypothetical protein